MNLLWLDRRKCLLLTHAGTLFPVFIADVRAADVRPLSDFVLAKIEAALASEELPSDCLGRLDPDTVRIAKTAHIAPFQIRRLRAAHADRALEACSPHHLPVGELLFRPATRRRVSQDV